LKGTTMAANSRQSEKAYASRRSGIAGLDQAFETAQGSGSGSGSGSDGRRCGSDQAARKQHLKFFPAGQLVPVALNLRLGTSIKGGSSAAGGRLHRTTRLIHAQDSKFPSCWFSRAIDLGNNDGTPAFWILKKTAMDTWLLRLRRGSADVAAYHLKTKNKHSFPIKLKMRRTTKEFTQWPSMITISE
jgi:hypothetical protein